MTGKQYMRRYGSFTDGTIYDNVLEKELDFFDVWDLLNEQSEDIIRLENENEELKQKMDNLFNYFREWFEVERGIYSEDFTELWKTIQNGDL